MPQAEVERPATCALRGWVGLRSSSRSRTYPWSSTSLAQVSLGCTRCQLGPLGPGRPAPGPAHPAQSSPSYRYLGTTRDTVAVTAVTPRPGNFPSTGGRRQCTCTIAIVARSTCMYRTCLCGDRRWYSTHSTKQKRLTVFGRGASDASTFPSFRRRHGTQTHTYSLSRRLTVPQRWRRIGSKV